MKYSEEQIIDYARRRMSIRKDYCILTPTIGAGLVVSSYLVLKSLFERDSGFGCGLIQNEKFILGFAFAVLFFMTAGIGAGLFATLLRRQRRLEDDALELLLDKLGRESDNNTREGFRQPDDVFPKPSACASEKTIVKQEEAAVVGPSAYLFLALLSSIVPIIHHLGLHEALENTRYPWGLHPIEILWLRDLGQASAWITAALAFYFILSFRVARLRTLRVWRIAVTLTLLFWVAYSIAASLTMVIQLNLGNSI